MVDAGRSIASGEQSHRQDVEDQGTRDLEDQAGEVVTPRVELAKKIFCLEEHPRERLVSSLIPNVVHAHFNGAVPRPRKWGL